MAPTQMELGKYEKPQEEKEAQEEKSKVAPLQFLREAREEFAKISWPSKEQVTREFFSVIILVTVLTGIIFLLDKGFGLVSGFFTGRIF